MGVTYLVAGGGLLELKTQSWWLLLVASVLLLGTSMILLLLFTDAFSFGYSLVGLYFEWPIALVILGIAIPLSLIITVFLVLVRRRFELGVR